MLRSTNTRKVWDRIFGFKIGDFVFVESIEPKSGEVHYEFGRIMYPLPQGLWTVWIPSTDTFANVREECMEKWYGEVSIKLRKFVG